MLRIQRLVDSGGFLWMLGCVLFAAPARGASQAPGAADPQTVANEFYKYHFSHDMSFTAETLQPRARWLTPELREACRAYFALPSDPEEVPDIDGDPFTGSQEYPDTFSTGPAQVTGATARVPLTFTWKQDRHSTTSAAVLKQINGQWLIDDVTFPDQDSFRTLLATQFPPAKP